LELLYENESYNIIGAAIEVFHELGSGFLEAVYQESLETEFNLRNIPYRREVPLNIYYKNKQLSKFYIADFICYDKIILEIKAVSALTNEHQAQLLNYLKATGFHLGFIINFCGEKMEYKRFVRESPRLSAVNLEKKPQMSADKEE
jgi:GxxExxY protein